jgi:hypothetical protein
MLELGRGAGLLLLRTILALLQDFSNKSQQGKFSVKWYKKNFRRSKETIMINHLQSTQT